MRRIFIGTLIFLCSFIECRGDFVVLAGYNQTDSDSDTPNSFPLKER
jgi:hypothetical protein